MKKIYLNANQEVLKKRSNLKRMMTYQNGLTPYSSRLIFDIITQS